MRAAIDQLLKWNNTLDVRPVLLTGAKGVGKTYLAYDFANAFFKEKFYLNFEQDPFAKELFKSKDPFQVSSNLLNHFHKDSNLSLEPSSQEDRILILDEISYSSQALQLITSLQYTGEFPRIIAISSNPIKKEELDLYFHIRVFPMKFNEFLVAIGKDWYVEAILTHYENNKKIPDIVHKELLSLHNLYLQIGGMPSIINEYLHFNNLTNVAEQHSLLVGTYQHYINLTHSDSDALKMNQVLNSLPLQLMKENKKFQYKLIRKGTTHTMYREAIDSLANLNYIIPSYKIITQELSNIHKLLEEDKLNIREITNFKLYQSDVGLLNSHLSKQHKSPYDKAVRKGLLENDLAITLQANGYPILFWESESMAKVDFLLVKNEQLVPVEVFCDKNTRSKSISVIKQHVNIPYSIKISSKNFDYNNNVKYVPYYATFCI